MRTQNDWLLALHHPDPESLVGMITNGGRPDSHIEGRRWEQHLALRIADLQWSSDCWAHENFEDWMLVWSNQLPHLDFATYPGEEPFIFPLLENMGNAECRYRSGRMHTPLWMSFVGNMAHRNLDFSATNQKGICALQQLLMHTTEQPYPEVAWEWIRKHDASFASMHAGKVIALMDRLLDPPQHDLIATETIPEMVNEILLAAINGCIDTSLADGIARWCMKKDDKRDMGVFIAAAESKLLERTTPRGKADDEITRRL